MSTWPKAAKFTIFFLAVLWIFDGLCQFQPRLLTKLFITDVIGPSFVGHGIVVNFYLDFARIFLSHPSLIGSLIGLLQILIGLSLIIKPTRRIALYVSIFWSLFVWIFGENLGGLLIGQSNIFNGFPGDALIYAILSLVLVISIDRDYFHQLRFNLLLKLTWFGFFLTSAFLMFLPSFDGYSGLKNVTVMPTFGRLPLWIANFDKYYLRLVSYLGPNLLYELIILQIVIAFLVFVGQKYLYYLGLCLAMLFLLVVWVTGQMAGMYYSGLMTDPNTALTMLLIGISLLFVQRDKIQIYYYRIEKFLT
jgi:hypothetical protein